MIRIHIIISALCIAYVTTFSFFYQEQIPQTIYQDQQENIVLVNFPYTESINKATKVISEVFVALTLPFNMTDKDYKTRSNAIYIQMDDFDRWLGKIYETNDAYKDATKNYKQFTPTIFDTELTLTVDSNYIQQKLDNLNLFKTMLTIRYNKYNTTEQLIKNGKDLVYVITTLELLMADIKHYYSTLHQSFETMNMAKQNHITDLLKNKILTKIPNGNLETAEIVQGGTSFDTVTIIVKIMANNGPITFFKLKPISYYGYALEDDYYSLQSGIIKKFHQDDKMSPNKMFHLTQCLHGLNKNIKTLTIEHCVFVKSDKTYEIIDQGIIFNNYTSTTIPQINKFLAHNTVTESDFPLVLHFNGTFMIQDSSLQNIKVIKNYTNHCFKSDLNNTSLRQLRNTLFTPITNSVIDVLSEEMNGVLISIASIVFLLISVFLSKCLYFKCASRKRSQKPQEKLILKKLKANRRYK